MPEPLVVRWTPKRSDLEDAYEARRRPLGLRRREFLVSGTLAVLCLVGLATRSPTLMSTGVMLALTALAILFPQTARAATRLSVKSIWTANPLLALPVEATLSAEGLRYNNGSNDTRYEWSAFTTWIESERVMVLCLSNVKQAFLTIPVRGLERPEGLSRLRALLAEDLGPAMAQNSLSTSRSALRANR